MKYTKGIPMGTVFVIIIVLSSLLASVWNFRWTNEEVILKTNAQYLQEDATHYAVMAADMMNSRLRFVEKLAIVLEQSGESDYSDLADKLQTVEGDAFLDKLCLVASDGICYFLDGVELTLTDTDFFRKGMQGESGISEIYSSNEYEGSHYIAYYAPVWIAGEISGLVVGCNYYDSFNDLCSLPPESESTYNRLVDRDGRVLLAEGKMYADNIFSYLEERMEQDAYNTFRTSVYDNETGYGSYRGDHGEGLVCFSALGINDWYIVRFFSSEKIAGLVAPLNRSAHWLEIALIFSILLTLCYTIYRTYIRYNQKNRLMEASLEALADAFPRLVRINFRTGKCIFIKDWEKMVPALFRQFDWEEFRRNLLTTIHPEDREKCRSFISMENMRRVKDQGLVGDTCIYRRRYEGEYQWMQTAIIPVKDEEASVLLYVRKVDESVKAEELYKEQLWNAMQKAKKAEMEKSAFLQYMSQDLRKPVHMVMEMSARMLEAVRENKGKEAEYYLGCIDSMGNYMKIMLSDIMQISIMQEQLIRCVSLPFSPAELLKKICDCYNIVRPEENGIRFERECDERLQKQYLGDEARLFQLLTALLNVLLQCGRKDCVVHLSARLERQGEDADRVAISICDAVHGTSREWTAEVLEIFRSGVTCVETGSDIEIGLSLARLALNAMDGSIEAEASDAGNGFTLYLNLKYVPEEESPPVRVLVVDDNPLSLEVTVEMLKAEGYETEDFGSGEQALRSYLDSESGHFEILLTDIKMPGMDGYELTKKIREAGRNDSENICVIALSAYEGTQEGKAAADSGIEVILEKPFHVAQFMRKEKLLRHKRCSKTPDFFEGRLQAAKTAE